jgi:nucleoside-diphosphate-sugar epimerase
MECFSEDVQRKIHFINQHDDFNNFTSQQKNLNHSRPYIENPEIKILAAMPALNEEKSIAKTILKVRKYVDGVIVVDDGSAEVVVMTGSNCALGHGYRISDDPFPIHYLPLDEAHPSDVEDSYSYSKLAGEELLASFTRAYGLHTYVTRPAGICPPERRRRMAENAQPATGWSDWMWGWVPSEDVAWAQRALMEKAGQLPPHDVYLLNGADTTALEETVELVAKLRPVLLPLVEDMEGHQAFFSTEKAHRAFGFEARYTWREYL